jgi:hypothetical protein
MKATDSKDVDVVAIDDARGAAARAEDRYSSVLYGEKLCRWSIRVRWWKKVCFRNGGP